MNNQRYSESGGFLAGLLTGGFITGAVSYLLFTKQGRKLSKVLIKLAEEYADKGQDFIEDQHLDDKVTEVVHKLKSKLTPPQKSLDIEE